MLPPSHYSVQPIANRGPAKDTRLYGRFKVSHGIDSNTVSLRAVTRCVSKPTLACEPSLNQPPTKQPGRSSALMAPLIPKLQGYFAKFLRYHSLVRLSVLHHPTCVSFITAITSYHYTELYEPIEAHLVVS